MRMQFNITPLHAREKKNRVPYHFFLFCATKKQKKNEKNMKFCCRSTGTKLIWSILSPSFCNKKRRKFCIGAKKKRFPSCPMLSHTLHVKLHSVATKKDFFFNYLFLFITFHVRMNENRHFQLNYEFINQFFNWWRHERNSSRACNGAMLHWMCTKNPLVSP